MYEGDEIDSTYAEQVEAEGGRLPWMNGMDDRAAAALLRENLTLDQVKERIKAGTLARVPNIGNRTAQEIREALTSKSTSSTVPFQSCSQYRFSPVQSACHATTCTREPRAGRSASTDGALGIDPPVNQVVRTGYAVRSIRRGS